MMHDNNQCMDRPEAKLILGGRKVLAPSGTKDGGTDGGTKVAKKKSLAAVRSSFNVDAAAAAAENS